VRDVYIVAVGMTTFGKYPDLQIKQLTASAMERLLADSPLPADRVEAAWMSNSGWGMSAGQHCIRGQVALAPLGFEGIPIMNVENACAGGSSALHGAFLGVASGAYDVALAIGAEKLSVPPNASKEEKEASFRSFISGTDVEVTTKLIEHLQAEADKKRAEAEATGDTASKDGGSKGKGEGRSPFMDIYSMAARAHMERYGTTQEQLAVIAAKNHHNGSLNPDAQYRFDMTPEEVLEDRVVSFPLTRAMCAPMGDGAAAALLVSGDVLEALPDARPVRLRASVITSGSLTDPHVGDRAGTKAYEMAGVGPEDVDLAEVHDATAFGELSQTERLGFCAEGEGGPYAASGATSLGGARPVNTSGGLECRGHPIGATGLAQATELVTQLRGEAGERQVEGARIALSENGGGFLGMGEAAVAVHVFERTEGRS
jgi:acetyl-CoA acetyltransferase